MGERGVFFAIGPDEAALLADAAHDDAVMALVDVIEERWDEARLVACDRAWDAMHRCLTGGELGHGNGPYPLSHAVLGPWQLHEGDEAVVSLVLPAHVKDVAPALQRVTETWFAHQYRTMVPPDYSPAWGDDDLGATWAFFEEVRDLYARAAQEGLAVLFVVDRYDEKR